METNSLDTVCLIPARGGSKGLPGKNIRPLGGKPLLAHTIEQARAARLVRRVVVTTDDAEIAAVAQQYGAEVVWRPAEISGDTATSESALVHALDDLQNNQHYTPDLVIFLQCTSPIRQPGDIDQAIQTLLDQQADSLLSVFASHRFLWQMEDQRPRSVNYDYRARPRRQDRKPEFMENGSIYVFRPWVLRELNNRLGGKIAVYEMDFWSSFEIDDLTDLELCNWILQRHGLNQYSRSSSDGKTG